VTYCEIARQKLLHEMMQKRCGFVCFKRKNRVSKAVKVTFLVINLFISIILQ